jgi:hypothetical protein
VRRSTRRAPGRRLILTAAALASLIVGYYLGQHWQRRALADLSAIIYPAGRAIDYPQGLTISDGDQRWRLFLVADTRQAQCHRLMRHFAAVVNRLATTPEIQERLRLVVLAYDRPDADALAAFTGGVGWTEVVGGEREALDRLSGQLGIAPGGRDWCNSYQASSVLVGPDRTAWALIPYEPAAIMAHNISSIVAFVE